MSNLRFSTALFGLGALALLATGCGPKSDQSLPQNAAQPTTPAGIILSTSGGRLPPGFTIQTLTPAEQNEMLAAVNAVRTMGTSCGGTSYAAAAELTLNDTLIGVGEDHAADMAANDYFSHDSQDGTTYDERITNAGYRWSNVAENISAGRSAISETVDSWYASAAHCANFMNPNLVDVGFGMGYSDSSTYQYYWVADLAKPL